MPDPVITLILAVIVFAIAALMLRFLVWPSWKEAEQEQKDEEDDMAPATDACQIYDQRGQRAPHACGHVDHVRFKISLWGRTLYDKRGRQAGDSCSACVLIKLLEVSRRCCDCGHAIMPGQMVKLCTDEPGDDTCPADRKTFVDGRLLGCLRGPCFGEGYRMAGHWTERGFVPRKVHSDFTEFLQRI